ncbi:YgfZ/GcvT domain-containing protein [Methylotuvimicrobium sp. KM1]|uniref:CAF17-like 4Fe-4S cluster assembly/insertion protein YgfZ n=1 Tax=Methylotuvimicrobium sp. KM1 TaxID=3377707 RepID=UPI00384AB2BA
MNQAWKSFLIEQQTRINTETAHIEKTDDLDKQAGQVCPVIDLAVLKVTGKDAARFLQGQVTCNINELTEKTCSFGAFCNVKGRVIANFLVLKSNDDFLLILPTELLDSITEKLRKYILRADVQLIDSRDEYCLVGINKSSSDSFSFSPVPEHELHMVSEPFRLLKLPSSRSRYLAVVPAEQAIELWSLLTQEQSYHASNPEQWRLFDIEDKIPWVDKETSEEFIPQMLNLDQLGGISFTKGCYTGQEIVARTHYLGKTKRMLFLAESDAAEVPPPKTAILDGSGQIIGKVLRAQKERNTIKLLAVLPNCELDSENIMLDTTTKDKIRLITL